MQEALAEAGFDIRNAELSMRPKTLMEVDEEIAIRNLRLFDKLEDLDDVQQVYSNLAVTDEVLAAVS